MAANKATRKKLSHKVASGDTLWDISREYDVTIAELATWNKLKKDAVLRVGQKLTVYKEKSHNWPLLKSKSAPLLIKSVVVIH